MNTDFIDTLPIDRFRLADGFATIFLCKNLPKYRRYLRQCINQVKQEGSTPTIELSMLYGQLIMSYYRSRTKSNIKQIYKILAPLLVTRLKIEKALGIDKSFIVTSLQTGLELMNNEYVYDAQRIFEAALINYHSCQNN